MFCGSAPVENCIEPDFTVRGSHEWDRELRPDERRETLFTPARFRYQNQPVKDPTVVRDDPEWPLASYWPVYVSNFMVNNWIEESDDYSLKYWYTQVSDFFAYKGFQTRMIYFHLLDTEYLRVQKKNSLIEALVYFGSEEEAERAIATCHRCQYFGHWLNVFPGRTPEHFCNERAVRLVKKSGQVAESFLENCLNPFGKVELIIRHAEGNILVQFETKEDMLKALPSQNTWKPILLNGPVRIQRFLESDVKMGIKWASESQEGFLDQRPRSKVLQYFEDGIHPIVENTWTRFDVPKISKGIKNEKRSRKMRQSLLSKRKRIKRHYEKVMKTEEYQKMSEEEKRALTEELSNKYGFNPFAPKKPRGHPNCLTPRQKQASVLKSVNWLLRQNGKPTLTKADQRKERDKALRIVRAQNKQQKI
uniref:Uncharacterized protein n=1 Tax=Culex tarsalis TaxID=7177 RepID=A0A1Q3G1T9_CULTA